MTDQELYSRVRAHLLTQRARSMNGRQCAYRGEDGRKCAIGCLIPDERYSLDLESWSSYETAVRAAAGITYAQLDLASALQELHDDERRPIDEWEPALNNIAARFGLSILAASGSPEGAK